MTRAEWAREIAADTVARLTTYDLLKRHRLVKPVDVIEAAILSALDQVAAEENEACALVADCRAATSREMLEIARDQIERTARSSELIVAENIAAAIRARRSP